MKGHPVYKGDAPRKPEQDEYMAGVGLDMLDALDARDPARDDICKRLCLADRVELMRRYGRDLYGRPLKATSA